MKDDPSSEVQTENRRLAAISTDMTDFSHEIGTAEANGLRLLEVPTATIQGTFSTAPHDSRQKRPFPERFSCYAKSRL